MKRANLIKRIKLNALGSAICSIGITVVQIVLLYVTGYVVLHDLNARVILLVIQLYAGSFAGLFGILHYTSTK